MKNEKKKSYPKKGDIYMIDFGDEVSNVGNEIRKVRPALIMSDSGLAVDKMVVAVPITSTMRTGWTGVAATGHLFNGTPLRGCYRVEQVRSLSIDRVYQRVGRALESAVEKVDNVLLSMMALGAENWIREDLSFKKLGKKIIAPESYANELDELKKEVEMMKPLAQRLYQEGIFEVCQLDRALLRSQQKPDEKKLSYRRSTHRKHQENVRAWADQEAV